MKHLLCTWTSVATLLLPAACFAQQNSGDRFFVVASAQQKGFDFFGPPSVNDLGDIVAKSTAGSIKTIDVYWGASQVVPNPVPGGIELVNVRYSTAILNGLVTINNAKSVATLTFSGGLLTLNRDDFRPPPDNYYDSTRIARADFDENYGFGFIGLWGIDDASPANVYFYAETQPFFTNYKRIFSSATETFWSGPPYYVSAPDDFSTLETYVAVSGNGKVAYLGTGPSGYGIYKGDNNQPVATAQNGFSSVGERPHINNFDAVAFYGAYNDLLTPEGIFLRLPADSGPRVAGNMANPGAGAQALLQRVGATPASYYSFTSVALNNFNQVAFLGQDAMGRDSIFATTMGSVRRLLSAGDTIAFNGQQAKVAYLDLHHGLGTNGQVVFLAGLDNGDEVILRAARGFTQTKLLESAIVPSYAQTYYLRSALADGGIPTANKKRIRAVGCNMTSTVNLLNFYGVEASPADFQNWLTVKWSAASATQKPRYITAGNDFPEDIVQEYTIDLFSRGESQHVVTHEGVHRTSQGLNLAKITSELRAGRAVKLRVPNGHPPGSYKAYGHYVMAYGLIDPSKTDANITRNDILIMDPGNGGVYTLGVYGAKGGTTTYDAHAQNWLEDDKRVYLYRETTPILFPPRLNLLLHFRSDQAIGVAADGGDGESDGAIDMVVRDSTGRRMGFDPAIGSLNEIPSGNYLSEETYYALDDDPDAGQAAWEYPYAQHATIAQPAGGGYTVEIIGRSAGAFAFEASAFGSVGVQMAPVAGTISAGERQQFNLAVTRPPLLRISVPQAGGGVQIQVEATSGTVVTLESGADLVHWTDFASATNTNGVVTFTYTGTNGPVRFFRAR